MPNYEYRCTGSCDDVIIKIRSIKDNDPGYGCETCNLPLERVYSVVETIFNGSGFYKTDNRKK